jgi:propanediol dehydratase small subunit
MAKTWDDFLPLLSPHLNDCPNATMKEYLAIVASDFFARTYLWREQIDAIYVTSGTVEYDLDADAVVEDVISVIYNDLPLDRTDLRLVATQNLGQKGDPREFWVNADRSIFIAPVPDERTVLKVYAVLKPSRTGSGVEDWIYETWADTLVSGTVARLAMIPNKEWTDVAMATTQKAIYERAITTARIRDFRGINLMVRQRPIA